MLILNPCTDKNQLLKGSTYGLYFASRLWLWILDNYRKLLKMSCLWYETVTLTPTLPYSFSCSFCFHIHCCLSRLIRLAKSPLRANAESLQDNSPITTDLYVQGIKRTEGKADGYTNKRVSIEHPRIVYICSFLINWTCWPPTLALSSEKVLSDRQRES